MVITWYGQSCFKIQSGELVIVIDPFAREIGLTPPRFRADIVAITHAHTDHANAEAIAGEPFLITVPGEYEVKGCYVHGIPSYHDADQGKERGLNTLYRIEMEDISILHMGDFGEEKLRSETLEQIGSVDILLIPVGGFFTIDGETAARTVKEIEPRYVIPMHYKIPGLKISELGDASKFLKEMAAGTTAPQEKFTIKKKEIGEEEKTEVIVLKPT